MSRSPGFLAGLPYAALTAVGMLATDLYLPAVPTLTRTFHASVESGQATLSSFFAGLAISQLPWGLLADRKGPRLALLLGMGLFIVSSLVCAVVPSIEAFIAVRFVEGLGAGVTSVVVPVLIRRDFAGDDAVRAIAWVGVSESIVPAAGPILGALLLTVVSWRLSFVLLVVAAVAGLALALRIDARHGRDSAPPERVSLRALGARYVALASSHALVLGGLISFIAAAPELLDRRLHLGPSSFATMQSFGVASFMLTASRTSGLSSRRGARFAAHAGASMQVFAALALLGVDRAGSLAFPLVVGAWSVFCAGLGIRGPVVFAAAIDVPHGAVGRASALIMLGSLGVASAATALLAPTLVRGFGSTGIVVLATVLAGLPMLRVLAPKAAAIA